MIAKSLEKSTIMRWICKRYLRSLILGAMCTCAAVNVVLHSAIGLTYYCEDECLNWSIIKPLSNRDHLIINYIKDNYVDPPFPAGSYKPDFPIENPPWAKMGKWGEAHEFIMRYFNNYKLSGTFIEVGAQDGEFMSFTLWLEQVQKFKGLLIEPNLLDYAKLREKKRSAYSINACAAIYNGQHKDRIWLREIPDNLPHLLTRLQEGSNRLTQYVAVEDRGLGKEKDVQCFNIESMSKAALNSHIIDFMSVSTHGGELDIIRRIPSSMHIRMLAVVLPLAAPNDIVTLNEKTDSMNLKEIHVSGNIRIFIPKREVSVV